MGMFDDIKVKYPLPAKCRQFQNRSFQTKDTPAQYLDLYMIRRDGTLWHQEYDTTDTSDAAKWKKAHPGKPVPKHLDSFCGCMTRINKRWRKCKNFTGSITFYTFPVEKKTTGWVEFCAHFTKGKMMGKIILLELRWGPRT